MSDNPPPERDPDTVARVKRDATQRLLAIPGVVAVGIGQKVVGDRHTGQPAIKVFVRVKRAPADVPAGEAIPPSIDGVLTDVEIGGDPIPIASIDQPGVFDIRRQGSDLKPYRAVIGGGRIVTFGGCPGGTGGCLLWDPQNHNVGYILTNYHVVKGPDIAGLTKNVTKIGQPKGHESSSSCCNDIVGVFGGGDQTAERDEAVVKLNAKIKWQAKIADIGMVAGSHTLIQSDLTIPNTPYKVAKRGQVSKVTGGIVTALSATTSEADNLIVIKPNPNPGAGTRTVFFAIEGDSGSALVNGANEVVGLVWARDDAGNGYAYHIDHVLKRLKDVDQLTLEVASTTNPDEEHTVPGGSFVEVPPEIAAQLAADPAEQRAFTGTGTMAPLASPWFSDIVPAPETVASVLDGLRADGTGQELLELWERHGDEARRLLERDRRVTLAWHRGGGAALLQLVLRLPADPTRALPATLNGRPLMECVDGVVAALTRAGTPALGEALARARAVVPDLAGLTYAEIVAGLHDRLGVRDQEVTVHG